MKHSYSRKPGVKQVSVTGKQNILLLRPILIRLVCGHGFLSMCLPAANLVPHYPTAEQTSSYNLPSHEAKPGEDTVQKHRHNLNAPSNVTTLKFKGVNVTASRTSTYLFADVTVQNNQCVCVCVKGGVLGCFLEVSFRKYWHFLVQSSDCKSICFSGLK